MENFLIRTLNIQRLMANFSASLQLWLSLVSNENAGRRYPVRVHQRFVFSGYSVSLVLMLLKRQVEAVQYEGNVDETGSEAEDDAMSGMASEHSEDENVSDEVDAHDGDVWKGFGDDHDAEQNGDSHPGGSRPKKPPTGVELRQIKDAADLYRSSSFKLQVRRHTLESYIMGYHSVLISDYAD